VYPDVDYSSNEGTVSVKKFWKEPKYDRAEKEATTHGDIGVGWSGGKWSNGEDALNWMISQASNHSELLSP